MLSLFHDFSSSQTLKNKVHLHLRQLIVTGQILPGSRLPEEDLSKQMNISRAPIREALNMLEREGFVTIIPRRGAIVSELTLQSVQDIWEIRSVLEPYAAKTSMHLIPMEEIDELYEKVLQAQANPTDLNLYMDCDMQLHGLLYKYKENHLLQDYISTTSGHSLRARYLVEHDKAFSKESVIEVNREHLRIVEALKKQDADELYEVVSEHVRNSFRRCAEPLQKTN